MSALPRTDNHAAIPTFCSQREKVTSMESAGACPVCTELNRAFKKLESQLFEERRWNLSQREYCIQLQQEIQKDKDLWQRQENKLRQDLKDLNNKIEDLYKTIQVHHKEKAHLEYKNEILDDQKQELQDKVTMLQDKVKHLCAEMSTAQYRARMLEEKLTATTKLLEESHKLKARISQAEGQKSRLEMKVNRLQEEKNQMQAELNHMRDENCQMQMQLIEQQEKLSSLNAGTQHMQANQALVKTSDSLLDNGSLRDSNWESSDFTVHEDNCTAFSDLQVMEKAIKYKDRNNVAIQNNCILKWQQQTAIHNDGAAAIHQLTEICTLTPVEVADSATECCDLNLHFKENCLEENGIKRSCYTSKGNQKTIFLNGQATVCDTSELDNSNSCFSCGNEIQMNIYKGNFEQNKNSTHTTTVSENVGNFKKKLSTANEVPMTFTDRADTINANNLVNSSGMEYESFSGSDNAIRRNALQILPHEQAEDIRKGTECAYNHKEKQADVETLHPRNSFYGECMSQSEKCCNATSEGTKENKDKFARSFTDNTKESTNVQHSTEINSTGSANSEIVSKHIPGLGTAEIKESNHTDNGSAHTKHVLQNKQNNQFKKEDSVIESMAFKDEASQTDNPDSVKTLEKALKENVTNKKKVPLNISSKLTGNRLDKRLMNKKTKPQHSKCSETENEPKLNEVSEEGCLDQEKCSQSVSHRPTDESNSNSEMSSRSVSPRGTNESSSNSENSSQRVSPTNNEASSNSEKYSKRVFPRGNELNKGRGKLSNLNKRGKSMGNAQQCKETNHSESSSESLKNANSNNCSNSNNNNNNANDLMNNINTHVSSRNIQTENEMLNDSASLQCETSNEEHLECEKASETTYKETCRSSSKIRENFNASSQNNNDMDNNVVKQRNVPQNSKNIHTENKIQNISLNKLTNTRDNSPVHKHNITLCNKYGCKYTTLNKNNKMTAVPKKTTSPHNRIVQNYSEISSSVENKNTNNNVHDNNLIHRKNILKYDRNNQTQSGVQSVTLSKNKNTDDNTVCQKNTSKYNGNAQSETEIPSSKSTDVKPTYNKNVLQCDKEIQSENGVQSTTLHKNSNNNLGNCAHKNILQNANGIPSVDLCKRNNSIQDDLVQKTNISQYNGDIQSQNEVQLTASNETYIVDDNLEHNKNKQQYHPNMQIEKTIESTGVTKNSNNKDIESENVTQHIALNKHSNITDGNLKQKNKMSQDDEHICESEVLCTALSKSNDNVDDMHYKMNTLQQPISSSNRNNVHDNFEQKKCVSQSNNNIKSILGIHPVALNKTVIDNYLAYKRNSLKSEKHEDAESRIQPITTYKQNGFVIHNHKINTPQRNGYIHNQNKIKLTVQNANRHDADNHIVTEKNKPHCSKGHGTDKGSNSLELDIVYENGNTFMINCDTSSSEMCNDVFDSNIETTKSFTQINSFSSSEEMDLVYAAKEGKFSCVEELLSLGTCPNCVCNGNTALHAAAETGNLCMCRLLLEAGARVDARDSFSSTPLHAAAKTGSLEVGKLLVKWGASVGLRDKTGNLPSDIAVNNGHIHMYNWLQEQVGFQKQ